MIRAWTSPEHGAGHQGPTPGPRDHRASPPARHRVAEPCTVRSAGGRVRDGLVREAGARGAVVTGVGGLELGQEVDLCLPRRGGLRLRARIAGIGVLGLLLDLRPADCGAEWREALLGMTDGTFRAA